MGKTKTKSRSVGDSPKPPITIRSTNVKILDDNIAKLEKAIQASDVSANPSGTAEEELLSTIGIDGKKYELGPSAANTSYDNTDSGLTATEAQAAIDELKGKIDSMETNSVESVAFTNTKLSDSYSLRFEKVGKIVELKTTLYASSDIAPSEVIGTVPAGYRPTTDVFGSTKDITINVGADGTVALKNTSATLQAGAWYVITMCYII